MSARSELKTFSSFLILKAMSKDSVRFRYLNSNDFLDCASRGSLYSCRHRMHTPTVRLIRGRGNSIFFRLNFRLRGLRDRYRRLCALSKPARVFDFEGAIERISNRLLYQLEMFGGNTEDLARLGGGFTTADLAFIALRRMATETEYDDKVALADAIREALDVIRTGIIEEFQWLSTKYNLAEVAGTESPDLGRGRLDPPATVPGTTAAHPAATGVTVTPSLAGPTAFWLQPANPVPAPGSVPFDSRLYYAGETVRPLPVATAPSSTAAHPAATGATVTPSLGEPSAFRLQPADPVPAPGTASTTDPGLFDVREIERLLGMGEGVSHQAPLPPPSAAGRTGAGAVAPPPGADPWHIRPPGMSGGPDPVAFGPWPAPPAPAPESCTPRRCALR